MKKLMKEFKEFAIKGNVMDLAVGVIIGSAFGKIVSSLVADVIMPFISLLSGKVNFADLQWSPIPEISVKYGSFLQTVFDFFVIAVSVFLMIKMMNSLRFRQKAEEAEEKLSKEIQLLTEIRDLLDERKKEQ